VRLGVILSGGAWADIRSDAEALEAASVDCCFIRDGGAGSGSAVAVAAALAAVTTDLRLLVEVEAGSHPVGIAEELAVCDLLLGGRLVAVVSTDDAGVAEETLDVLAPAFAGRRFRHDGTRWSFPADPGAKIEVTPAPAQIELPVWLYGQALAPLARQRSLTWLAPFGSAIATNGAGNAAVVRQARLTGDGELETAFSELSRLQHDAGVGLCILDLLDDAGSRGNAIRLAGTRLRPRLQGSDLPPDLVASWD
jgi:alkanesulfonate monooxygenase SsuD/methylene tetrahydromethanopterin reductase-like flavin-dependent oxidoreductase (luciferase family)